MRYKITSYVGTIHDTAETFIAIDSKQNSELTKTVAVREVDWCIEIERGIRFLN